MSFAANMEFFAALQRVRDCLLQLSAAGYVAHRVRMHNGRAVVEINSPLAGIEPIAEQDKYQQVEFCGCAVVWRKPESDEGHGDDDQRQESEVTA